MNQHRSSMQQPARGGLVHRRDCLKALAAGLVAAQASSLLAGPWLDKAKKNIRLGIDGGVYARFPVEEAASRIKDAGFRSVLCSYNFADARFDPLANDWKPAEKIAAASRSTGSRSRRRSATPISSTPIRPGWSGKRPGCTRSWRTGSGWAATTSRPRRGPLTRRRRGSTRPRTSRKKDTSQCRDALAKLAKVAEKFGAVVSIEAYWRNCIDSIDRAERLVPRGRTRPALKLVMDPCNYYRKEDLPKMQPMLEEMFKRLGGRIVVAHAKDVKAAAERDRSCRPPGAACSTTRSSSGSSRNSTARWT